MYECDRCNTTQSSVLMCSGTQVNMTFYNGSACNPQNVSYSTNVSSSYDVGVCINLTALWAIPDFYYDDGSKPEPFYSDNGSKPEPFVDPMPTRKLLQNYSLAADGSASSSIVYDNDRRAQPGSQMWVCDNGMLRQISYSDELCQTPLPDNTYTHVCSTDCLDFPYDWDFDGRDGDDAWTTVVDAATGAGGNYSGGYAGDGYASDYPDEYETCPDDGEDGILVRMCVADADGTLMPVEAVFDNERACVPANYTAARFWQPLNSTCAPAMLLNMTLPMRAQSVKLYDCNNTQTRFPVTYFYNSTNCTGQAVAREAAPYTRCDKCCKDCPKERPPSGNDDDDDDDDDIDDGRNDDDLPMPKCIETCDDIMRDPVLAVAEYEMNDDTMRAWCSALNTTSCLSTCTDPLDIRRVNRILGYCNLPTLSYNSTAGPYYAPTATFTGRPQPSPAAPMVEMRMQSTFASLTLTDMSDIDMRKFRANFTQQVAKVAGVARTQVQILDVKSGSVVVDFSVQFDNETAANAQQQTVEAFVADPAQYLSDDFVEEYGVPTVAIVPDSLASELASTPISVVDQDTGVVAGGGPEDQRVNDETSASPPPAVVTDAASLPPALVTGATSPPPGVSLTGVTDAGSAVSPHSTILLSCALLLLTALAQYA